MTPKEENFSKLKLLVMNSVKAEERFRYAVEVCNQALNEKLNSEVEYEKSCNLVYCITHFGEAVRGKPRIIEIDGEFFELNVGATPKGVVKRVYMEK